jgi:hypothetical protein
MSGSNLILLGGSPKKAAVDPYFYSVTSLLHGDGTNGAQNNTFLDSSTNNFTITRNGNTTQGSFSPFSQTGWGNYFDGTGDFLSVADNAALEFGNSTLTLEMWINTAATAQYTTLASRETTGFSSGMWALQVNGGGTNTGDITFFAADFSVSTPLLQGGSKFNDSAWHHVAIVRNVNSWTLYIDGIARSTATWSGTVADISGAFYIGASQAFGRNYTGYISNLRFVKGTAVYTSAFTVPTTSLTAITNTSLLTCQANRFLDASSNAFAITRNGDVSVQPFSPFNPLTPYSTSAVGGSGYFDGAGDNLDVGSSFSFNTGTFTVEFWYYPTKSPDQWDTLFGSSGSNGIFFSCRSGFLDWTNNNDNAALIRSNWPTLFQWSHIALVQDSGSRSVFINGVRTGNAATYSWQAGTISLGNESSGYFSDWRVVVGQAIYSPSATTITVPTAPLTAISGTSLLCNFTNAGIFDNAADADYETVGNAQISTSVKKYGTGSMSFDGTGDYLTFPANYNLQFGTGDFTIEFWTYLNSVSGNQMFIDNRNSTGSTAAYITLYSSGTSLIFYTTGNDRITATSALSTSVWLHVALCRVAGQTRLFINGTQVGTTYADTNSYLAASTTQYIGSRISLGDFNLNGYIDDFRISKGIGRYPYNFTPPTAEFPNIGGTVTLTADPYYDYTTLLLPGNGTNGAQNNTFLDSSTNSFSITRNGNTTQGTFSPFSQTGWGNFFDGTNSKVTMASNAAMSLTGQFTIECWVYWNGTTLSYQNFIGSNDTFSSNASFFRVWGTGVATLGSKVGIGNPTHDGTSSVYSSTSLAPNQWYHVAATRDSSNIIRVFVNGNLERTGSTDTSTYDFGQGGTCIGDSPWDGAQGWYSGYISNLRVLKGTCLYTTSFTPPTTALTNISNTSLLTCQSNRFVDNSSNAFALTPAGNASIQAFSPFNPTASWSAATYGGSGYFDGSGDYLNVASSSAFAFPGNFTIEAWVYPNTQGALFPLIIGIPTGPASIQYNHSSAPGKFSFILGATRIAPSATQPTGQWYHVAAVRNGSTVTLYINGTSVATTTDSASYGNSTLTVGGDGSISPDLAFSGYIADARVVKGTAVYTANFTPPTAPLTAITNTSLLTNFTNAGILDATSKNDLETVGNAQISTAQSKFGGSSMYFDGTGDYLFAPSSQNLNFRTGDFTIEGWFYLTSTANAYRTIFYFTHSSGSTFTVRFGDTTSYNGKFQVAIAIGTAADVYSTSQSATNLANGWHHFAFTRYASTARVFIDGIQQGLSTGTNPTTFTTMSFSNTTDINSSLGPEIGRGGTADTTFLGYIQDLRITRGIARYTSNFTPPTTAFLTL